MSKGWFWKCLSCSLAPWRQTQPPRKRKQQSEREEVRKTILSDKGKPKEPCSSQEVLEKHVWKSSEWKKTREEEEGGNAGHFRRKWGQKRKGEGVCKRLTKLVWTLTSLREQHKSVVEHTYQKKLCHHWGPHALVLNNASLHTHLRLLSKACCH